MADSVDQAAALVDQINTVKVENPTKDWKILVWIGEEMQELEMTGTGVEAANLIGDTIGDKYNGRWARGSEGVCSAKSDGNAVAEWYRRYGDES